MIIGRCVCCRLVLLANSPQKMKAILPQLAFFSRSPLWLACLTAFTVSSCNPEEQAAKSLLSDREVEASADALFGALNSGDDALADALVTVEVDPSSRDSLERTPLMLSAGGAAPSLVSKLVGKGADLEARDSTGRTALAYAVEAGQLDAVLSLLQEGAEPSVATDTGGTLIAQAMRQKRQAAALLLLEAGADTSSKGLNGESLARIAVEENQTGVLAELVRQGVNIKETSISGVGLSHLAMEKGQDDMVGFLLETGMDSNAKNARGESLIHVAVGNSKLELLDSLKKHGAELNALDPQGWSPLHLAVLSRDHELVDKLLSLGSNVDQFSGQKEGSMAPLSLAIENRFFPIAHLLLRHGAKPQDEMYQAVARGGEDGQHLVEILIESGATASPSRAPETDTPLGLAARKGEYEIAKALMEAGASHEVLDGLGQKPFHSAVARGDIKMVKLFLDAGADPNETFKPDTKEEFIELVSTTGVGRWALRNSTTMQPLMIASDSGNVELAQLLIDSGAEKNKLTRVKRTRMYPLSFASRRNDTEMMQVLLGREPGRSKLWIRVDLSAQRAYLFEGEKQIYSTRVSTGKSGHRTRKGKFVITNKYRNWTSTLYGSSMPYFQRLSSSDFGFHVGALPGYAASHGCIRMPYSAARKLFGMTKLGDYVEIVP